MKERTVYLVGCSSLKLVRPAPARELYRSPLFRTARKYVEQQGCEWHILSARYGLLHPNRVVSPYDSTLGSASDRRMWASMVLFHIEHRIAPAPDDRIVLLAGRTYTDVIAPLIRARVERPLDGMGIGERLRFLNNALRVGAVMEGAA